MEGERINSIPGKEYVEINFTLININHIMRDITRNMSSVKYNNNKLKQLLLLWKRMDL